jgi:hypothetical protein
MAKWISAPFSRFCPQNREKIRFQQAGANHASPIGKTSELPCKPGLGWGLTHLNREVEGD